LLKWSLCGAMAVHSWSTGVNIHMFVTVNEQFHYLRTVCFKYTPVKERALLLFIYKTILNRRPGCTEETRGLPCRKYVVRVRPLLYFSHPSSLTKSRLYEMKYPFAVTQSPRYTIDPSVGHHIQVPPFAQNNPQTVVWWIHFEAGNFRATAQFKFVS
jgi:hypothetical protein